MVVGWYIGYRNDSKKTSKTEVLSSYDSICDVITI